MGCIFTSSNNQQHQIQQIQRKKPPISIKTQIKHLRISCDKRQQKLSHQLSKSLQIYIKIIKEQSKRNKIIQYNQLSNCCLIKNQIHSNYLIYLYYYFNLLVYNILKLKLRSIQDNIQHLDNPSTFYVVKPNLQDIVYLQTCLNDDNLKRLTKMIKKKYRDVSYSTPTEDIKNDKIIKHHKNNTVQCSQQMVNQFVLILANQQNISLEEINQSGNNFCYQYQQ